MANTTTEVPAGAVTWEEAAAIANTIGRDTTPERVMAVYRDHRALISGYVRKGFTLAESVLGAMINTNLTYE